MEFFRNEKSTVLLPPPVVRRSSSPHRRRSASHVALRVFAVIGALFVLEKISRTLLYPSIYRLQTEQHFAAVPAFFNTNASISGNISTSRSSDGQLRPRKAIIASSVKEDNTSWIAANLPDWEANVYVMNDEEANVTVAKQKGREAAAYLSYIITHYHNLPDYMVFIHAQQYQWHNDDMMFNHLPNLQNIRLEHVANVGYTNLRCSWNPGCPVGLRPDMQHEDNFFEWNGEFAKAWRYFFPHEEVPSEVGQPCCAQFAVTRERVQLRPVQFYEKIRQWLWDSEVTSQKTGRILEYTWHKMFGEPAVSCPNTQECYCKLYGYCDLDCEEGTCKNRLWPLRYDQQALPEKWPEQGQGENGMPEDGWWLPNARRPMRMQLVNGHWEYGSKYSHDHEDVVRK